VRKPPLPPATTGVKAFEPGLLAKANRGILYVDEVNLLDDHLVDVLLDSAASGWNTVEREGISISHPARFILVGSGEGGRPRRGLGAW
jgi:magnesium chelatase subunit I